MFLVRPRFPRFTRELGLLALAAAAFLIPLAGQPAFASTLSGSWYMTDTNSPSFPSGSNYAQVTVSVDSNDKVTFNASLLPGLANSNYLFDKFGFNWAGSTNIASQLSTALANASSPLNNWSVSGSNGSPSKQIGGMGKYNYLISAHGNGN